MPNKCCVPGYTGNYEKAKKIQVFSFPKDGDALNKWLRVIPRKDFVPTSCTKVCAVHFDASYIERTTSYTDPTTGRVVEVVLPVPRLRPVSVPTYQTTAREKHLMPRGADKKLPNSPMLCKNHWRHTKRNKKETVFRPSKD
ncbi:hypothetical protein HPB52_020023 [Rhipicephalus sanguineus]|uniref:THAP-type domain-containing protein n=1 Tax=Rhipicephalus sanguineus TaxID=34632 RepID=A0A9D4PH03_RHISA|nr:hypothetical protein HPB52_020023 [Rhipicephalus sanguineus]